MATAESREERRLIRQRGAGARELSSATFGFTFAPIIPVSAPEPRHNVISPVRRISPRKQHPPVETIGRDTPDLHRPITKVRSAEIGPEVISHEIKETKTRHTLGTTHDGAATAVVSNNAVPPDPSDLRGTKVTQMIGQAQKRRGRPPRITTNKSEAGTRAPVAEQTEKSTDQPVTLAQGEPPPGRDHRRKPAKAVLQEVEVNTVNKTVEDAVETEMTGDVKEPIAEKIHPRNSATASDTTKAAVNSKRKRGRPPKQQLVEFGITAPASSTELAVTENPATEVDVYAPLMIKLEANTKVKSRKKTTQLNNSSRNGVLVTEPVMPDIVVGDEGAKPKPRPKRVAPRTQSPTPIAIAVEENLEEARRPFRVAEDVVLLAGEGRKRRAKAIVLSLVGTTMPEAILPVAQTDTVTNGTEMSQPKRRGRPPKSVAQAIETSVLPEVAASPQVVEMETSRPIRRLRGVKVAMETTQEAVTDSNVTVQKDAIETVAKLSAQLVRTCLKKDVESTTEPPAMIKKSERTRKGKCVKDTGAVATDKNDKPDQMPIASKTASPDKKFSQDEVNMALKRVRRQRKPLPQSADVVETNPDEVLQVMAETPAVEADLPSDQAQPATAASKQRRQRATRSKPCIRATATESTPSTSTAPPPISSLPAPPTKSSSPSKQHPTELPAPPLPLQARSANLPSPNKRKAQAADTVIDKQPRQRKPSRAFPVFMSTTRKGRAVVFGGENAGWQKEEWFEPRVPGKLIR